MSNNSPIVSIIVPVYKVEQYLPKCIESILEQTFQDWELLLIDDGSPDNSGKICDEYALRDARIRVIHKENGGVSSARNFGLDCARGEYVMFVDSDDWLSSDCLQVCIEEIKRDDLDALQFGTILVYPNIECLNVNKPTPILDGYNYLNTNSYKTSAGSGVYKKSIIYNNDLRFPKELRLAEDQYFMLMYLKYTQRIKYLDRGLYYYLKREDSAVHTPKSSDMLLSCRKLSQFAIEWPQSKKHIDKVIVNFILSMIKNQDVTCNCLKEIYLKQNIHKISSKYKLERLFVRIAKYNFCLAYYLTYIYLKIN